MALIENTKGRRDTQSPSGYTRLFGVPALGNLMSRIQGAVISSGNELERLIWERVERIDDLDRFLVTTLHSDEDRLYVTRKEQIKKSASINSRYEPDFLALHPATRRCYIIEVKDGDQFDTKKAAGEHAALHNFNNDISQSLPYSTSVHLCSFNANTREEIRAGLKGRFSLQEVMTGRELCDLFGIDYDEIIQIRTRDQRSNLDYVINEILKIGTIRDMIVQRLRLASVSETVASSEAPPHESPRP